MKKEFKITIILAVCALALAPAVFAQAEENATNTAVTAEVNVTVDGKEMQRRLPPPQGIGAKIKANLQINKDERNKRLEERKDIREERRADIKDARIDAREDMKAHPEDRKEIKRDMRGEIFKIRLSARIKQFTVSITNLESIATRIGSRITKSKEEGRNVTESEALLVTANTKISAAKANLATFASLVATASSTGSTTSSSTETSASSSPIMQAGMAASKSIDEARNALKRVLMSLGHALGKKIDFAATTTTSTASTTTGTTTSN